MRPWNEIIAEARDRNKDYTLDEFCDVYERYYEPTEKLPGSGKTPNQKNRNKANQFRRSNKTYSTPGYDDDGKERRLLLQGQGVGQSMALSLCVRTLGTVQKKRRWQLWQQK